MSASQSDGSGGVTLVGRTAWMAGSVFAAAPFVHCRIQIRHENDRVIVHLAGRLGEAEVPDLLEACAAGAEPPILELDELISADAVGMDALLRIEQEGARLVGLPEYIRLKLDTLAHERLH